MRFLPNEPLTKRQLGWLIVGLGLLAGGAILAVDRLGAGQFTGLGPAQWRALGAAGLVLAGGLSLVARGDRLA